MAGDRAPRLLPWVAGRFVQVTGFDDLIEPWAGRLVAQVGIAAPATVAAALIHQSAAVRVEAAIAEAVAKGATLHTGGTREGAVIAPTVLSDVDHGLPLYCAEVFAPVVLVEAYDCLDDAIDAANSTPFALQAAVFTGSLTTAARCFRELRAGSVIVNRSSNYRLDQLPYGGIGESGIGREGPLYAAEAMSYLKSLVIVPGSE